MGRKKDSAGASNDKKNTAVVIDASQRKTHAPDEEITPTHENSGPNRGQQFWGF